MIRAAALLIGLALAGQARGSYIDSINPDAASPPRTQFATTIKDIGWYYTPTASFNLTGIYSRFEAIDFGTGSREMTVQIRSERPAEGGTILGQGTFTGDSTKGGVLGAAFGPVLLTAGTTYFVDFLRVDGMGVDLGEWQDVNGVHVASGGATTRLGGYYTDGAGDASFSTARLGNAADQSPPNGNVSGAEPILFFSGSPLVSPVPEPSSLLLLGLGMAGACGYRLRMAR